MIKIIPGQLTLSQLRAIAFDATPIQLDPASEVQIKKSCAIVDDIVAKDKVVYGINTGFGLLAKHKIAVNDLKELQRRLVLSHATGVGANLSDEVVRLLLVLKINSLACGYSGIRLEVIRFLIQLYNNGIYPCIPCKGSVGASGDLAPLAHMSTVLLGVGNVRIDGNIMPAKDGLAKFNLKPIDLGPKEGLALLNGTQVSTALALSGLFATEDVFAAAVVAGSLSVDAALGSDAPFDARIQEVRRHQGQQDVAALYRTFLKDSPLLKSHANCEKVQDPYSLRCQPQVMGACLDQLRYAANTLETEANAVSDNPLVFAESGEIISGGNFHAEPVAFAADALAIVLAEIGSLSERRTALLIDPHMSGLPAFLVAKPGLNSGFMIAQVTAAALVSENKSLAHPASVDSIPTSANQEDHVSMATFAARRLTDMANNSAAVVAIEILAATQGIHLRNPLKTSSLLQKVVDKVRDQVPPYDEDRYFAPDIAAITTLVQSNYFYNLISGKVLPSNS